MNYIKDTLKNLLEIDSPSGFTKNATEFLINEIEKLGFKAEKTNKGSIYTYIDANKSSTVALSGHTDTLGLIVRSFNSDGTLNVTNVGGPILSTINGEYCKIYTRDNNVYSGTILNKDRAVHVHKKASDKVILENLIVRLDEKVTNEEDLKTLNIEIGDFVCYDPKVQFVNDFVKSRFLDDKAGVVSILQVLKDLDISKLNQNLLIFFSVYEEVGHGGSSMPYNVNELIAVDMGCVGEDLNGNEYSVSICAKDSSGPYDYELTTSIINCAKKLGIDYAVDVYPMYGSDASAFLRGGNDARVALIGPGVDASHGMERTTLIAIQNSAKILVEYITN